MSRLNVLLPLLLLLFVARHFVSAADPPTKGSSGAIVKQSAKHPHLKKIKSFGKSIEVGLKKAKQAGKSEMKAVKEKLKTKLDTKLAKLNEKLKGLDEKMEEKVLTEIMVIKAGYKKVEAMGQSLMDTINEEPKLAAKEERVWPGETVAEKVQLLDWVFMNEPSKADKKWKKLEALEEKELKLHVRAVLQGTNYFFDVANTLTDAAARKKFEKETLAKVTPFTLGDKKMTLDQLIGAVDTMQQFLQGNEGKGDKEGNQIYEKAFKWANMFFNNMKKKYKTLDDWLGKEGFQNATKAVAYAIASKYWEEGTKNDLILLGTDEYNIVAAKTAKMEPSTTAKPAAKKDETDELVDLFERAWFGTPKDEGVADLDKTAAEIEPDPRTVKELDAELAQLKEKADKIVEAFSRKCQEIFELVHEQFDLKKAMQAAQTDK